MKIRMQYGERVLCLPGKALERIADADGTELRFLLALADTDGEVDLDEVAGRIGASREDALKSLNFWRGAGVLVADGDLKPVRVSEHLTDGGNKISVVHSGDMPSYTGPEIERLFDENARMRDFVDECQRLLGKMLSVNEINKIIGLIDYYRFSGDFVLLLVKRCIEIGKGSIPYIVKTAISLYNGGIVTVEALEERIREEEEFSAMEFTLRKLMGMGKRAMTEKEKRFVQNWTDWKIPDDMLELVYGVAVDATGGPSMPYMNKVLTNWREAGYKSAEDARAAMEQYKQKKAAAADTSSFDRDEFFEAAIRHSLEIHGKKED